MEILNTYMDFSEIQQVYSNYFLVFQVGENQAKYLDFIQLSNNLAKLRNLVRINERLMLVFNGHAVADRVICGSVQTWSQFLIKSEHKWTNPTFFKWILS